MDGQARDHADDEVEPVQAPEIHSGRERRTDVVCAPPIPLIAAASRPLGAIGSAESRMALTPKRETLEGT